MANDEQNEASEAKDESQIKTVRVDPVAVRAAAEAMKADMEAKAKMEAKEAPTASDLKTVPVDPKAVQAAVAAMKAEMAPAPVAQPFQGIFIPPPRNLHDN
jgi:hypothetical protein